MNMYVIVRNDLSASYKMVQGAHALADFALRYPDEMEKWGNNTLIFLAVPSYRALIDLQQVLGPLCSKRDIPVVSFDEVDLDYQLTALCLYCDELLLADLPLA
jgi:hypothetical protein